jgi:hypothetical protein
MEVFEKSTEVGEQLHDQLILIPTKAPEACHKKDEHTYGEVCDEWELNLNEVGQEQKQDLC